jgi:PAS domain S-box-containing protein
MRALLKIISLSVGLTLLVCSPILHATEDRISILVVTSGNASEGWQVAFKRGIFEAFSKRHPNQTIALYNEIVSYDLIREVGEDSLRQALITKYQSAIPDYVMVLSNPASMVMASLKEAWPSARVLHVVDNLDPRLKSNRLPTPHAVLEIDPLASVVALNSMLTIKHVYFVLNKPSVGDYLATPLKLALSTQLPNTQVSWLMVDQLDEALPVLQKAPAGSAAYLLGWQFTDAEQFDVRREAILAFADAIDMPLLSLTSHDVGFGVLGGWVVESARLGQAIANVLDSGESLPWRTYLARRDISEWVFDANRVTQFNVDVGIIQQPILWRQPPVFSLEDYPSALIWRWVLMALSLVLIGVAAMLFFANRRKTQALKEVNQELSNLIKATDVGTWRWNISTGEVVFNERWAEIIGYRLEEIMPLSIQTWEYYTHPDDLQESDRLLQAHFRGETPQYNCEVRMRHRDGHWVWVFDSGQVMEFDASGQPSVMYGIHLDINQRKAVELECQQAKDEAMLASKAKSHFLSNMSHEIRTPTHGILGVLELLKDEALSERQLALVKGGMASARALLAVLGDIWDFSKIESGKLELDIQPMELGDFVEDLQLLGESLTSTKQVTFQITLAPAEGMRVLGDVSHLRQVMINLIGNAIKFTERGAVKVHVDCQEIDANNVRCEFSVSDTGIGIPDNMLKRIFEGFEQVNHRQNNETAGTGLGLTIASQLVKLMGGTIDVKSKLEEGSTFSFSVVLAKAKAPPMNRDESVGVKHSLAGYRFLLVEDSPTNQMIAKAIIEGFQGSCEVANNGAEAIIRLRENPADFDMVLMDLRMPVMDGYTATKIIREEITDRLPIVALSANVSAEDRDKSLKAGMLGHLGKPFVPKDLLSLLSSILKPKSSLEECDSTRGSNE